MCVFDSDALGSQYGSVTLSFSSGISPDEADTITIDPKVIDQICQDFVSYRASVP
jgi:hypothetical protein